MSRPRRELHVNLVFHLVTRGVIKRFWPGAGVLILCDGSATGSGIAWRAIIALSSSSSSSTDKTASSVAVICEQLRDGAGSTLDLFGIILQMNDIKGIYVFFSTNKHFDICWRRRRPVAVEY